MVLETAAIVTVVKPLVEKVVVELISPKIKQFAGWCKGKYKENLIPTAEHFQKYLERIYEKYSNINVLAVPNSQFQLKNIYVTQTIVKGNRFESEKETTKIDRLPVELIKKYKKLIITDTAGMGKSTIMKYMFIDLIDNGINDVGIPIFVELNRLNKNRSILIEIQEEMDSLSQKFDSDLLFKLIQTGGFIFFMDGYDEISIADRSEVTKDIHSFISKAGTKNYYILSSRPDDSLASFGDFQSFKIQPLAKKDAFELLTKYDISNQKKISKELIKELDSGEYNSIDEYLVNPLLVSLLYITFNHKAEIPLKKHQFYRQVYDALFNSHKLAQGQKPHEKHSGLDIDDFNRVLRYVGYECLISIGVQFDKDTILNSIKRAREFCGNLKFGESDFLKDLVTSVPLFTKDGTEYKWSHKSLMEYFAARFIAEDAKEKQDLILSKFYNSEDDYKYINTLDIYYDIDYKGFSKNITLPLCENYLHFYQDNINKIKTDIDKELIDERIACIFNNDTAIIPSTIEGKKKAKELFLKSGFTTLNIHRWQLNNKERFYSSRHCYNLALLRLLYNKNPRLYSELRVGSLSKEENLNLYNSLKQNKIYRINVNTGDNDKEVYRSINEMMQLYTIRRLNYSACKKEVDKIKKEMTQCDNFDDLINLI